ncbi:MAG TPA: hypothetical protein VG246_09345 [Acidimicrobiales bacterium]|nr:hypothetical protein [Acidimicrobiales bacterium]
MSEMSGTRRELEASLRSLLPESNNIGKSITSSKPGVAAIGFGGVLTGYVWGRIRGRRRHKQKKA